MSEADYDRWVEHPTNKTPLAGDWHDDDGRYLQQLLAPSNAPGHGEGTAIVVRHETKPVGYSRLISGSQVFNPAPSIDPTTKLMVLPADERRNWVTFRANPLAQGGWVTLVQRQIINAATTVIAAKGVVTKGMTAIRVALKVFSVAGTTPTIKGTLLNNYNDGSFIGGNAMGSTPSLTAASTVTAAFSPIADDLIRGMLDTTGASGDSVIDAELMAYLTPDTGVTNGTDYVLFSDESNKLDAVNANSGLAFVQPLGQTITFDGYTGPVWFKPAGITGAINLTWLGTTK